jgi:hypothetical protein
MRQLAEAEQPHAGETVVRLRNNTAHVTHLSLRDGAFLTVAPTVGRAIAIALTADEKAAFDRAWATPTVKAWVAAGDVLIDTADDSAPPSVPAAPAVYEPPTPTATVPPTPTPAPAPAFHDDDDDDDI